MRYFKYKNTKATDNAALKAQYAELTKEEKQIDRKNKLLDTLSGIVFYTVSFIFIACCIGGIIQIPAPENWFLVILYYIAIGILLFISAIVCFIIGGIVAYPIRRKKDTKKRVVKRKILSEACLHLSNYYELQDPCIVTKCYDSSDKRFANHDVCIFVAGDELRITTNLKHGFFHGENDLGCYAFKSDEISVSKLQGEKFLIAELKLDDVEFSLGYRAKSFIEKNFLSICSSL